MQGNELAIVAAQEPAVAVYRYADAEHSDEEDVPLQVYCYVLLLCFCYRDMSRCTYP
jgi:hypothetical protein